MVGGMSKRLIPAQFGRPIAPPSSACLILRASGRGGRLIMDFLCPIILSAAAAEKLVLTVPAVLGVL